MIVDEEPHFELVMPFVVCQSNGGPYADDSFAAGFAMGRLDAVAGIAQSLGVKRLDVMIRTATVAQADLIAMRHHGSFVVEPYPDDQPDALLADARAEWTAGAVLWQ